MKQLNKYTHRRYYLHSKVKSFCKVKARPKVLFMTEADHLSLTGYPLKWVNELINLYKYSLQYVMPL